MPIYRPYQRRAMQNRQPSIAQLTGMNNVPSQTGIGMMQPGATNQLPSFTGDFIDNTGDPNDPNAPLAQWASMGTKDPSVPEPTPPMQQSLLPNQNTGPGIVDPSAPQSMLPQMPWWFQPLFPRGRGLNPRIQIA